MGLGTGPIEGTTFASSGNQACLVSGNGAFQVIGMVAMNAVVIGHAQIVLYGPPFTDVIACKYREREARRGNCPLQVICSLAANTEEIRIPEIGLRPRPLQRLMLTR